MDKAMAYVKKLNEEQKDVHITMTHIVTQGAAWGLYKMRRDVGRLPWGTFKSSEKIGVTVLVDFDGGKDLVPVTIWDAHKMTIFEIAKYVTDKVQRVKKGKDERHNKSTATASFIPSFIAQPALYVLPYIAANLGISLNFMGVRSDTFGHIVVTNVGPMGYTSAFAPLCPPLQQMALICTGTIQKRPIVKEDGKIEAANMMTTIATGDHRFGDAAIMVPYFRTFRGFIEDPENFDEKQWKDVPHWRELKDK